MARTDGVTFWEKCLIQFSIFDLLSGHRIAIQAIHFFAECWKLNNKILEKEFLKFLHYCKFCMIGPISYEIGKTT